MISFQKTGLIAIIVLCLACKQEQPHKIQRPKDPWAFRSVLDKKPQLMISLTVPYTKYGREEC